MRKIDTVEELQLVLEKTEITQKTFQSLDLSESEDLICKIKFSGCLFLNCVMSSRLKEYLSVDNYIFPALDVPFDVYPSRLYNRKSLYAAFDYHHPETYYLTHDKIVYDYYRKIGNETRNIKETLARALHDHSIKDEMNEFLDQFEERKIVAVMGGHKLGRDEKVFIQLAQLSKQLTEKGSLMITGGGPGAMEATHLGAWFAGKTNDELNDAVRILSVAPLYDHPEWLSTAIHVMERYPETGYKSLGIPTWLYGHELSTPFATHIAKFFENSLREEGLLAVAKGGVIFAPGSAGTMQEIFQDLAQNHYESYGYASPMIFLNQTYWTDDRPIYPLIQKMIENRDLKNIDLSLYDENSDIIAHLEKFVAENQ